MRTAAQGAQKIWRIAEERQILARRIGRASPRRARFGSGLSNTPWSAPYDVVAGEAL